MSALHLTIDDIPSLADKTAIITGGASGIGLAAAEILASRGCNVHILDLSPPEVAVPENIHFTRCDVTSWSSLLAAFKAAGPRIDIAIANAGISEDSDYLADTFSEETGELLEPPYRLIDVNYKAVLNFVKIAVSYMRKIGGGSVVITSSATAYAPEHSLPVYSATKLALIGLVRALRVSLPDEGISINSVAPAATITKLLPQNLATPLMAAGLPVSTAEHVGLAVVYSAVAGQSQYVEPYGKDNDREGAGKWNGRTILTLGDTYTELEESIARLRPQWFGQKNTELTRLQQAATDFRVKRNVMDKEDTDVTANGEGNAVTDAVKVLVEAA